MPPWYTFEPTSRIAFTHSALFVFGRGGEEVEALRAAGLAVSVVPGITAALGAAASVGIPLTHRRFASAVTFVTGHGAEGGSEAAWPALAAQGHTLAIYMGATEAQSVRDRLLDAGTPPNTPVAIVEKRMQGRDHPVLVGVPETYYLKCFILRRVE